MALTQYDKNNLTAAQQAGIQAATERYNNATTQAERDAAHAQAEAIRNNAGYTSDASGAYSGAYQSVVGGGRSGGNYNYGNNSTLQTNDRVSGIIRDSSGNAYSAQTGMSLAGIPTNDWVNDTTDYGAKALNSQSIDEIQTWLARRGMKADAQGIDISGNNGNQSNQQIYDQWWESTGKYIPNSFLDSAGNTSTGYYGRDENGNYGYFADAARTVKLENGNWGKANGQIDYDALLASYGMSGNAGNNGLISQYLQLYNGQNSAYAQALAAQQAAQEAAVQKAVNTLESQKADTTRQYNDLFRQLYINKMKNQKNIGQQMAAQGINGGAAESTLLSMNTQYEDALRQGEQGRLDAIRDLDQAIADARLTGDIQSANAAADAARDQTNSYAGVLQDLIDRYDTLAARQTANDREDAETARRYAYQTAMQILGSGNMASDELLASAGIGKADAAAIVAASMPEYAPSLTAAQVNAAIKTGTLTDELLRAYEYYYGAPYRG